MKKIKVLNCVLVLPMLGIGVAALTGCNRGDKKEDVVEVKSISIECAATLEINKTLKATAKVFPENATNKEVTWTSSNQKYATVDQNGNITGVAMGDVTITATAKDGSGVVSSKNIFVLDPIVVNSTVQLRATSETNLTWLSSGLGNSYLKYSFDGKSWNNCTSGTKIDFGDSNDKRILFLKGYLENSVQYANILSLHSNNSAPSVILSGSLMNLLLDSQEKPATELPNSAFYRLFLNSDALVSIDESFTQLLPVKKLNAFCYNEMFRCCANLQNVPMLPAVDLDVYCYSNMFQECTSLTTLPENLLPAIALKEGCYIHMFDGCTKLSNVPSNLLSKATTLAEWCFESMFSTCSNFNTKLDLPATTLAKDCYSEMFYGCEKLTAAPSLPASSLVDGCYYRMFRSCESLMVKNQVGSGTLFFTCPSTIPTNAVTEMFNGTKSGGYTSDPVANEKYYYE